MSLPCAQVDIRGSLPRSPLTPLPKVKALFQDRAASPALVWMESGDFTAKLTETSGRERQTSWPHGADGSDSYRVREHADPSRMERRLLCCPIAAAALQRDTSLSICSGFPQPPSFALQKQW